MSTPKNHLIASLLGQRVIEQVATVQGVKPCAVRVLGLVYVLSEAGLRVNARQAAKYLDCHYLTALAGANECVTRGWLERQQTIGWGLRVTIEGARMAGLLERAEREARVKVQRAELPRWPRKYTRRVVPAKLA